MEWEQRGKKIFYSIYFSIFLNLNYAMFLKIKEIKLENLMGQKEIFQNIYDME